MKQHIDTFIGFDPKDCVKCFQPMEIEKVELIIVGDENYTKKTYKCKCGFRINRLCETVRTDEPKRCG